MDVRVVGAQGIGPHCSPDVHIVVDSVTIFFKLSRSIVKGLNWVVEL